MVKTIAPAHTKRAQAFELWMKAPMPMVTLMKTLDVTQLVRFGRKKGYKPNMLLCWCIGKAAAQREEFYLLPEGDHFLQFDALAIDVVVKTKDGDISTCDIPFSEDLEQFNRDYLCFTQQVAQTGEMYDLSGDRMVIGTSVLADYEIDGAVNIYAGIYHNPFLIWGKFRKRWWKWVLPVSFQFHHTQMDGIPAAQFLQQLQRELDSLSGKIRQG